MDTNRKQRFIINITYALIWVIIAVLAFKIILPAAIPFIVGFVIALILRKPIKNINENLKIPYKISAIFVVTIFYIILILLITSIGVWTWYGLERFVLAIPSIYTEYIEQAVVAILKSTEDLVIRFSNNSVLINAVDDVGGEILSYVSSKIPDVSLTALGEVTGIAKKVPTFFIKLVLTVISTFFIAIDYNQILNFFKSLLSNRKCLWLVKTKEYLTGTLWIVIKSYLIIMSLTFVELSIGLTIINIDNSIILALLIAIFDILPVLGTGGVMIPWAILSAISGDYNQAISIGIIYLVITVIRNIIEPRIVGKQLGLHPLITLILMFIGVTVFGVVGLFGLPITLSLLLYLDNCGVISIPLIGGVRDDKC